MAIKRVGNVSLVAVLLILLVTACGGPAAPPEGDATTVHGTLRLPSGSAFTPSELSVTSALGTVDVSADGSFNADVLAGGDAELGVETDSGELLLLGVADGPDAELSAQSTAVALLFYAIGGMWLPAEHQATVWQALKDEPAAKPLAQHVQRLLAAGVNPLTEPDQAMTDAIDTAREAVIARVGSTGVLAAVADGRSAMGLVAGSAEAMGQPPAVASSPLRQAVDASNIVIEPTTRQSGADVLQNPGGAGAVAQNHMRRPAKLLVYEMSWEDADHVETPVDPPVLVESVDVPATGQLEFFHALGDVLTGDAPWSPVLSPSVNLAGHEGASRTHYQLVLLGPGFGADQAIVTDARFASFHDAWDDIVMDKTIELFLDDLLLPLVETYAAGSMARFDAAKLNQARAGIRRIYDNHLLELGVYLRQGRVGYAQGLRFVLSEMTENATLRLDMMNMVKEALDESASNKVAAEAIERRLASRASASAVAAAVQGIMVSSDIAKIMYDLDHASEVAGWTAVSAPALFALTPDTAWVTKEDASAQFTLFPRGQVEGDFLYRWSTSGSHGDISDLLQDGTTIDTTSREIWYFHDDPAHILDSDVDTVKVEVFAVDPGATAIPPGATPMARATATVRGQDRDIDSRIEVHYGTTPVGMYIDNIVYPCAEMYLRFPMEAQYKTYDVYAVGVGGQGDPHNTNQQFRQNGPNQHAFVDPAAKDIGSVVEDGYAPTYKGVCTWMVDGHYASQPITFAGFQDIDEGDILMHLFTIEETGFGSDPATIAELVPKWYDWVNGATFTVKGNR